LEVPSKKFSDVFKKMNLSPSVSENLKDVSVKSVCIEKINNNIEIILFSDEIIRLNHIRKFESDLRENFEHINKISVIVNYDKSDLPNRKIVRRLWENILILTNEISPLCAGILKDSERELEDNNLIICIKNNSSYFLNQKSIVKMIENYINTSFDINIKVQLKNIEVTQAEKEQYEKNLIEKFNLLAEEIQKNAPTVTPREIVAKTPAKQKETFYKQKDSESGEKTFGNFGRSSVKINDKLLHEYNFDKMKISNELRLSEEILVAGVIFELEIRETKAGKYLVIFDMTDETDSLTIKFFVTPEHFEKDFKSLIKKGNKVIVKGTVQNDAYAKELNVMAREFCPLIEENEELRIDKAEEKRVELHLHTKMSAMDAINTAKDYIERAVEWGHKAIAITDHGVVQSFPEAMNVAKGKDIKILYGVEAYLIDDLNTVVECPKGQKINCDYVVFDIETTGLHSEVDKIIEIGAVKISNGQIIDKFGVYVNPKMSIPEKITELTGIVNENVIDAETIEIVLPKFLDFVKDAVLVAHNTSFDMSFIRKAALDENIEIDNTVLDTLELSRLLLPELSRHKLNIVAKHLEIRLINHHRATDDAEATAEILLKLTEKLQNLNIETLEGINEHVKGNYEYKNLRAFHCIILVQNYVGLRNLYELVSLSHLEYFYRRPRIPKSKLLELKEGLIIGSACEAGEFFKAVFQHKPKEYLRQLADFYDYLEIQPIDNNMFMFRNGIVSNINDLNLINKRIVDYGEMFDKPVVATCDVHFLDPKDSVYRKIIMFAEGFKDADIQAPLYYRTTEEMLREFSYLGEKKTREVVIENPNKIADMIDDIIPVPKETFPPHIDGAEEEIQKICYDKAKEIYGDPLPEIVAKRLEKELNSIIKNGFSVMYIIAQKLVWNSLEHGYLVGSRGSVGSSFVATMLSITEVNPLSPHYICPECKFSDFDSDEVKTFVGASGCDMPEKFCPNCGTLMNKDGHDIPFETFLGFDGDKEPDIDLNFSGEYQSRAHAYTEELFGKGFVFKAGTIGTLAEKTAYGFVKKYFDERGTLVRNAEVTRLRNGCTGVKRTTGQHPGGLLVVPSDNSIYNFTPVQRPANDQTSDVVTSHFDYHSIEGRLLKLDLLGHDVPTIIRYLHDTTGIDPRTVDLGDKKVMSLFTSPDELGVKQEDIHNCPTGSLGLPEFGTTFVRQMLIDTQPKSFAELVRISGLSHGTDVWFNNAQDLIKDGIVSLKEVIPTRDDIMVYLINKGVESLAAFKIMENVRKGKGVTADEEKIMKASNVPDWYIESCRRIKYMFPKGHAVAYVMMTVRIGYFKIHYPYSFYGATFSVKAEDFDYEKMCLGIERVKEEIRAIETLGNDATAKEKNNLTILEIVLEMYARGLKFVPMDLYKSDSKKFIVTKDGLLPPLSSIQGLGVNAAEGIVEERKNGEFQTIEEFRERTKTTKTVIEILRELNILRGIPETDQLSIFNFREFN